MPFRRLLGWFTVVTVGILLGCAEFLEIAMAEVAEKRWTVAEFLDWDDGTDRRYELVEGRIVAMAPPSEAHATIVMNLGAAIRNQLPASMSGPGRAWRQARGARRPLLSV
jgi:Uma2 family endonuclease